MPDATEWLVEHDDPDDIASAYEHIASREDAIAYLRQLIGQGKRAILYQRCPFTVNVDVTVKARRTRKQKASPAPVAPSDGPPPSGSEPPSAGESKERAASQHAAEADTNAPGESLSGASAGAKASANGRTNPASPVSLIPTGKEEESPKEGAERHPAPSPVCEASWPGDPACPGPAEVDPATGGWFSAFHLVQVPESFRVEMHRLHKDRNAPVVRLAG